MLNLFQHLIYFAGFKPSLALDFKAPERFNVLVFLVFFLLAIYICKKSKDFYLRPIDALSAVDDAIKMASEKGKPILFTTGVYDMDDIQVLSGISILSSVARKVAETDSKIIVPCAKSLVMVTTKDVIKNAYTNAGKPEKYDPNDVFYFSDDQFAFAAGVDGIISRAKPAVNFFMGFFLAEALIMAETGNTHGAIQIAGTANIPQIPFFVASCDYTLIGEELFAASAYLSKDPVKISTVKAQDYIKVAIITLIITGAILSTVSQFQGLEFLARFKEFFSLK